MKGKNFAAWLSIATIGFFVLSVPAKRDHCQIKSKTLQFREVAMLQNNLPEILPCNSCGQKSGTVETGRPEERE